MTKYDSLEINTAEVCVTLEITRTFKGSSNWYLRRFQQKTMDTIEEGILNAQVCSAPNLQKLEIRHFGNKSFNYDGESREFWGFSRGSPVSPISYH